MPTLNIPQKLYGRELEIRNLLSAFDRVKRGATEAVLVSGHPGIGKTALIHEIRKPIVAQNSSYFVEGKFDQLKKDVPYNAVIQAFKNLVGQLLTESERRMRSWRQQILTAVGSQGRIITDVIPDVERIIGTQPEVSHTDPLESQNRFNRTMRKFVRVFAGEKHPLVIFLDDLQWIDPASLNLLKVLIMDPESKHLLIIGAYRDTEVGSTHPFMHMVDELTKSGVPITATSLPPLQIEHVNKLIANLIISAARNTDAGPTHPLLQIVSDLTNSGAPITTTTLPPLRVEDVNTLLADVLKCPHEQSDALAGIVYQKTQGNPFFIIQILNVFCEKGLLVYEPAQGWTWRIEDINRLEVTDSIVDLLVAKINRLAPGTQSVLKIASCIGNRFDLETLASVYKQPLSVTYADLSQAIQEYLIIPSNEQYTFFHDRIQEAADSLLSDREKKETHCKIGYLVLAQTKPENRDKKVFYIADQLNAGAGLITDHQKKIELAELDLMAGRKAKASTAFASAAQYLTKGIVLLPEDSWRAQYDLTLALHMECSENQYLSGNFEEAERLFNIILKNAKTNREKAEVYRIRVALSQNRGRPREALEYGREGLKLLGLSISLNPGNLTILKEFLKIKWYIGWRKPDELALLPQMTDAIKQLMVNILMNMGPAAYYYNRKLLSLTMLHIFTVSLRYGNTPVAPLGYTTYGFVLCAILDDYKSGFEFAKLGVNLSNRYNDLSLRTQCNFTMGTFVNHWTQHLKMSIDYLTEGYINGLESGNFVYASYCAGLSAVTKVFKGDRLTETQFQCEKYLEVIKQAQFEDMFLATTIIHRMILGLRGLTNNPLSFSDNQFNEASFIAKFNPDGKQFLICIYHVLKLPLFYLFYEFDSALEMSKKFQRNRDHLLSMFYLPHHNFYYSLTLTALYPAGSPMDKWSYWRRLKKNQKKMKVWANNCPENCLNKYTLVAAEMARVRGKYAEAESLYDQAITLSRENEFIQEQAIANELAAKFYLSRGNEDNARSHLQEARTCYQTWGAVAKVKQLEEAYPNLLKSLSKPSQ